VGWQGIEGHDAVWKRFVTTESRGRIAGTYLFLGPEGVGKGTFARALAKALICPAARPGLVPCGSCASCAQADAGSHPDIDVVEKPEDRATIPLEAFIGDRDNRMREGLCWRMLLRPVLGKRKVAIILDADHLSEEGANCLLKTLEEPPDGAVVILVGTALERQLPTIRSRSQIIRFSPLAPHQIADILRRGGVSGGGAAEEALITSAAARCGGSLAQARLLLDPEVTTFRTRLLGLLAARPLRGVELSKEVQAAVEAAGKEAPARRARLRIILAAAVELFRAALRADAGGGDSPPTEDDAVLDRAVRVWGGNSEEAVEALHSTLDALDGIERNAHLPTLIDAWTAHLEPPPAPPRSASLPQRP
jgi:DNA polymerase-3 subunit delta'